MNKHWIAFALICGLFISLAHAQVISTDSSTITTASDSLQKDYFHKSGNSSTLYTGSEYEPYSFVIKDGNVFFNSEDWINGNLSYNQTLFKNILLKYDIVQDKIITPYYNKFIILQPVAEKVDSFSLDSHHFINIQSDSSNVKVMPSGFYEVLLSGRSKIFVKRRKIIEDVIRDNTVDHTIKVDNTYYLFLNGKFNEFNSQTALIDLLGTNRHTVNAYLRSIHLKYRRDPEQAMIKIVVFADESNKNEKQN